MIKKIVAGCVILILAVITYWVGRFVGAESASKSRTKRDVTVHTELVKLDEMFLTNVVTRPSTLATGFYRLETKLAGKPTITSRMDLEFSNGRLTKISGNVQNIVQTGSVVSWEQHDRNKGPSARFVGVIDGEMMWGRVYVAPGQGWREGDPPEYGIWTLRTASADAKSKPESVGSGESSSNSSVASDR